MRTDPREFWRSLGSPKYIVAPMVNQSELAFRMLCRKYGAQLAYTPMLHSRLFSSDPHYRKDQFSTCDDDNPLVAQFCGNDPKIIKEASKFLPASVNAIDINFGCPQSIAKRGRYGAFLLEDPDFCIELISQLVDTVAFPVCCKIRKLHMTDAQKTVNFCRELEARGCVMICIHGRTKDQNKHLTGSCDWDLISFVRKSLNIPVVANGGVDSLSTANKCLEQTGVAGVMSAEAILENPALFNEKPIDMDILALEYMYFAENLKSHMFAMLYSGLKVHTDLRSQLSNAPNAESIKEVVLKMYEKRRNDDYNTKLGWYNRYKLISTSTI